MPQTTLKSNAEQVTIVHRTPAYPVSAGDVYPVSAGVYIAPRNVAAGSLGAFYAGGGEYVVPKVSGVNQALPDGVPAYWNQTVSGAVSASAGNKFFGVTSGAAAAADLTTRVLHLPPSP